MASAWGSSWGSAWGNSWGAIAAVVATRPRGWDDSGIRRRWKIVYEEVPDAPPPLVVKNERKFKRRRITAAAIEAATSIPWAGLWEPREARAVLPQTISVPYRGDGPSFTELAVAIAAHLHAVALADEEDIEMLLLAAS